MADIVFTPAFKPPTPWVDGRDRVRAAGAGGFNDRFSAIATDFAALHNVVGDINTSLNALGQQPTPTQHRITLSPMLMAFDELPGGPWRYHAAGFAFKPEQQSHAFGVMSVSLPAGARLRTFRVVGEMFGQPADPSTPQSPPRVTLGRSPVSLTQPDGLASVALTAGSFDGGQNIDPARADVDDNFKYFIHASTDGLGLRGIVVRLYTFQIIFEK